MQNKYLTKVQREQITPSENQKEILTGLYLGDLHGQRQKAYKNARLMFKQGLIHKEYLDHLYDQFKDLCPSGPQIKIQSPT